MYWLGIDIGTGGTPRAAGGPSAATCARASPPRTRTCAWSGRCGPSRTPATGGTRRRKPSAACSRKRACAAAEVRGIGLSGQMHGLVILDEADRVIRPSLIWCDQRSQPQVDCDQPRARARERPQVDRQSRAHRLHAARSCSGCAITSRANFARVRRSAAAQGLRALPPHRRVRHRSLRRLRHLAVRRGEPPLVVRDDGRPAARPRHPAAVLRIERRHRHHHARGGRSHGPRGGHARGGRRRRPGVERGGQRHRRSRASSPARSAPPAWCSRTWKTWPTIPPGACTPSATPCAASGTSWASRRARGSACNGSATSLRRGRTTTRSPPKPPRRPPARRASSGCPTSWASARRTSTPPRAAAGWA